MTTIWAIVIIFLDLVLIIWSMVDIRDAREENALIAYEVKRQAKEKQDAGLLNLNEVGIVDDDWSDQDSADDIRTGSKKRICYNIFTCKYLRGGSGYELVNVFMNTLSLLNILFKFFFDF